MNYKKDEVAGWEALGAAVLESAAAEWCDVMSDTYANKNDATERKDAWGGYWQRLLKAAEDEKYIRENAVLGDELADRIKATLAETQLATAPSLRLRKGVRLDRTTKKSTITAVVTMSAPREKEYQLLIDFFEAAMDFFPSFKTEGVEGGEA